MKILKHLLFTGILLVSLSAHAQPYKTIRAYTPYKWMIGVHWVGIEDDGNKFGNTFDISNSWSYKPFPTSFTLDRYFGYGWSAEAGIAYMEYSEGTLINDSTNVSGFNVSFDANGKYSFYNLYAPRMRWIEPYVIAGLGFTYRDGTADPYVGNVNLGGGLNFWFSNYIGMRVASTAKFSVYPGFWETPDNYMQYTGGLVIRTPDQSRRRNQNRRKQHKWTRKQPKKYKNKRGH